MRVARGGDDPGGVVVRNHSGQTTVRPIGPLQIATICDVRESARAGHSIFSRKLRPCHKAQNDRAGRMARGDLRLS
jgi:hypothetical protein